MRTSLCTDLFAVERLLRYSQPFELRRYQPGAAVHLDCMQAMVVDVTIRATG